MKDKSVCAMKKQRLQTNRWNERSQLMNKGQLTSKPQSIGFERLLSKQGLTAE
jgi:hypothetical protein